MSEQTEGILGNDAYVAEQNQVVRGRVEKMQALRAEGVAPYAMGFRPDAGAGALQATWSGRSAEEVEAGAVRVRVAGRMMAIRAFGKAAFVAIKDGSGSIQAHMRKDLLGEEGFGVFKRLDLGDVIGVEGVLFLTKTGELTVRAERFVLLTKSLRPLPEKWHGLTDLETRLRQRYVDLMVNDEVRAIFRLRSQVVSYIRSFLDERSFVEVETPMMHTTPGGASARPFVTHHNALDMDLFLRIAPELYLKRLVVGGFERVYEVNRNFRNEGLSRRHNPEFTMLELYQAYATYTDLMEMTEELVVSLCHKVRQSEVVEWGGHRINMGRPWRRLRIREGVAATCQVSEEALGEREVLETLALALPEPPTVAQIRQMSAGHLLMALFEQLVEGQLIEPTFVTEYPAEVSPLARRNDEDPAWVDRFELFIGGIEVANAFNELNDPLDQRQRFLDQLAAKVAGDEEAHPMDEDYVRALEYGMPPTAGEGIGIDRLVMLLSGSESIREVILFPLLRPERP